MPIFYSKEGERWFSKRVWPAEQIALDANPLLERVGRPDAVAIEADVLPAERSDAGEQLVVRRFALAGCPPRR
jgi:hypothetical protein